MPSRVEAIDEDIALLIRRDLSAEARSQLLAEFARDQLAIAEAADEAALGVPVTHETFVDGRQGGREEDVRPDGTIVYEFDLVTELFAWIDDQLIRHSPVRSGRYARSHLFLADGEPADPLQPPASVRVATFINDQPYARKIEGDNNRSPESKQAPDGVYEVVASMAARRFGNVARISFGWQPLTGGAVGEWAASSSARARGARRGGRPEQQHDWLIRQPAITVTVL